MLVVCFHQKIPTGLNFTTFVPGLVAEFPKMMEISPYDWSDTPLIIFTDTLSVWAPYFVISIQKPTL